MQRRDPSAYILNYRFEVMLGNFVWGFSSIQGLEDGYDYDLIQEGGVNDYPHVMIKPAGQPGKLIFERGLTKREFFAFRDGPLAIGRRIMQPGSIFVYGQDGEMAKIFKFDFPMVIKWELGPLDGMNGQLLIRKLEVLHQGLHEETRT